MPIYEYRCDGCEKKFSLLTLRVSERPRPKCPKCGGRRAHRLMSRFAMPKSEEARLDALADPSSLAGIDENDPRSVGKWMRKMGKEMGEDLADSDLDEMVDQMEGGGLDDDGADNDSSDL